MTVELADRLQRLRKKNGYTQDSLADALGVSRQAVSKWECTEASPDTDNLIALARLYGITLDELIYGKDEEAAANSEEKTDEKKEEPAAEKVGDSDGDSADGKDGDGSFNIHVEAEDGTKVHIGSDGIRITDGKGNTTFKGSNMNADESGIHVTSDDGTEVHPDGDHIYVNEQDLGKKHFKTGKIVGAVTGITTIVCLAAYILLGALLNLWHPAWIIFLAIIVIPSFVEAILKRDADKFAYPVFVAAIYLIIGCIFGYWHPSWVVFLTIPVYYIIVELIKKR